MVRPRSELPFTVRFLVSRSCREKFKKTVRQAGSRAGRRHRRNEKRFVPVFFVNKKRPKLFRSRTLSSNKSSGLVLPTLSGDPPNCARSPIDGLFRSTTDGIDPNNAPVRHSNPAAGRRPRGCARRGRGQLCPVSLPLFRLHVGTSIFRRRAWRGLLQTTKAPRPLRLRRLFFHFVDSRLAPLSFRYRNSRMGSILWKQRPPFDTVHPVSVATGNHIASDEDFDAKREAPALRTLLHNTSIERLNGPDVVRIKRSERVDLLRRNFDGGLQYKPGDALTAGRSG
jgi:hypothetical protein